MKRWVLVVLTGGALLAGCERFAARSDVAALVGDHQLSAERVAGIMGKSGGGPTVQAAEFISNLWLDYSLFGRALAEGKIKTDSATVEQVLWPTLATARVRMWRDSMQARRAMLGPNAADSAYAAGTDRVFQHIIVIPGGPTVADTAKARKQIDDVLARVKGGAKFGEVAKEVSADGSKNDEGYLPFGPKGQFVKEFEDAAWALNPGDISPVVKSQFGFHIIRRPPLAEAKPRVEQVLVQKTAGKIDSAYVAELSAAANMKVASGASAAMKTAIAYPEGARGSKQVLVSLKSGDVTLGDFVRWTAMFPTQAKMQIRNANDSLLGEFAKDLGYRTLMLRAADSAGMKLAGPMRQFAQMRYQQTVDQLRNELGLSVPELSDSSKLSAAEKTKVADTKIEEFFARLLDGKAQMQVVMPELADHLRTIEGGKVNQAGVARAVELAQAKFSRDSVTGAAKGPQPSPGAVQQAPGGPPIGGDKPADAKKPDAKKP